MPPPPNTHPTVEVLRGYCSGTLDAAAAASLGEHLRGCEGCRCLVTALGGNPPPAEPANRLTRVPGATTESYLPVGRADVPPELRDHKDYQFERELGRGGMGVVYLVTNRAMRRREVLKVMNRALAHEPEVRERFLRELRAAARLNHTNVATAYATVPLGDAVAFTMEYVEGDDLAKVVERAGGSLPVANACYYLHQAALGLQHAFEKGLVHRDLKPNNLILARDGKKHVVKIVDFGLAKLRSEEAGTNLTGAQTFGTPAYMAPEQWRSTADADVRSDIYSLGCTLYYLLAGEPPFVSNGPVECMYAHQFREPKPLHELRRDVPVELAEVVRKMLAKDPAQRYQKPSEVAQALAPFFKPGAKPPDGPPAPSTPAARRRTAGMPTQLPGNVTTAVPPVVPARPAPPPPEPKAGLRMPWRLAAGAAVALLLLVLAAGTVFKAKVKTAQGDAFIVLEIDQPGAEVLVDGEKISVHIPGDNRPVEIQVAPGRHKLRVSKDGFEAVTRDVELRTGKFGPIRVQLEKAQAAGPKPAEPPPAAKSGPVESAWLQKVAALPAEQQVGAVGEKLKELNPGFDGRLESAIRQGLVTQLTFSCATVQDIAPLCALTGLRRLNLATERDRGKLTDLTPLRGMKLLRLNLGSCGPIDDLSPLQGMKLTWLNLGGCRRVGDLTPLRGMPLTWLSLFDCEGVRNLTPLQGMPLTHLDLGGCRLQMKDLAPLKGMKLTSLNLQGLAGVPDFTLLEDMPLRQLGLWGAQQVGDLTPLRRLPLRELWLHSSGAQDLTPLEGMQLEAISVSPTRITRGLDVLRHMNSLKTIRVDPVSYPAAEFWQKYDAGDFNRRNVK